MPMVARLPGKIKPGTVDDQHLCSNLDFAQTLLDYAQVENGDGVAEMQGMSLKPILESEAPAKWRDAVYYRYWMHLAHHFIPGHYGIRDARYKLVFIHGLPLDASLGQGSFPPTQPGWEFYDLEADPKETRNVYLDPDYQSEIKRLKKRLLELKAEYRDTDETYPELMKVRQNYWNQ